MVVYLYHKDVIQDLRILHELESIDDDLEALDVHLVKLAEDGTFAEEHNIMVIPSVIIFKEGKPIVFPGDVGAEQKVIRWVKEVMSLGDSEESESSENE